MLQDGMMAFALLGAEWVMWVLVLLSFVVVAVTIERVFVLWTGSSNQSDLGASIQQFIESGDAQTFSDTLRGLAGVEARVLHTGLEVLDRGPHAIEKAMVGAATAERMKMERGLSILATVGSNAPFIGLFGTVLGIIQAFHELSLNPNDASTAVMAGIAEALVATAIGLMVAIPAVVLYNILTRWVKTKLNRMDSLADLVLAKLHPITGGNHGK